MPVEKGVDDEEAPVTEDSAGLVKNSNSTKIDCHVGFCRTAQVPILNQYSKNCSGHGLVEVRMSV